MPGIDLYKVRWIREYPPRKRGGRGSDLKMPPRGEVFIALSLGRHFEGGRVIFAVPLDIGKQQRDVGELPRLKRVVTIVGRQIGPLEQ